MYAQHIRKQLLSSIFSALFPNRHGIQQTPQKHISISSQQPNSDSIYENQFNLEEKNSVTVEESFTIPIIVSRHEENFNETILCKC